MQKCNKKRTGAVKSRDVTDVVPVQDGASILEHEDKRDSKNHCSYAAVVAQRTLF